MIVLEAILMGIFATLIMDFLARYLVKTNFIISFVTPEAIGRWFLYIFRGKLIHKDIYKTPAFNNEKSWSILSHYLIGIVLAGIYLLLEMNVPIIRDQIWMTLIFGIATVFLPWFWLLPSIGLGFMASKSSNRSLVIRTSLVNHTDFGLGLLIWIFFFHRFFI
jgi:hypothetical protein